MDAVGSAVRIVEYEIEWDREAADILNRQGRGVCLIDGDVEVVVGKEPVCPEPIEVFSGHVVERIEEVPGEWMFAMPPFHIGVQAFAE